MVMIGDLELGSKGTAPKVKFGTAEFLMEVEKRRSIKVSDSLPIFKLVSSVQCPNHDC